LVDGVEGGFKAEVKGFEHPVKEAAMKREKAIASLFLKMRYLMINTPPCSVEG
jgi:hypothetical protein